MSIIQEICRETGQKVRYDKYRMWHSVPYIGKTALVIDNRMYNGGYFITQNPKHFPEEVTKEYILKAIEAEAFSLGEYANNGRRKSAFIPFSERTGYPPGFFSHKVGDDVVGD